MSPVFLLLQSSTFRNLSHFREARNPGTSWCLTRTASLPLGQCVSRRNLIGPSAAKRAYKGTHERTPRQCLGGTVPIFVPADVQSLAYTVVLFRTSKRSSDCRKLAPVVPWSQHYFQAPAQAVNRRVVVVVGFITQRLKFLIWRKRPEKLVKRQEWGASSLQRIPFHRLA